MQGDKVLYTAKAHTTVVGTTVHRARMIADWDIELSSPGTPGTGTNPEQLFATSRSARFLSAIKLVAGKKKITLPPEVAIDAEIDLGMLAL